MSFGKPCLAIIIATVVGTALASGGEGVTPPTSDARLQVLIDEALAQNPGYLAARQMETAARSQPAQAGSIPGPMLGVFYENDGAGLSLGREPMTRLGVSVGQEIPYPGKRAGRRRLAETEAALAVFDVQRTRLTLIASVKRAYYGLVLARGIASLALQHREIWREIQETARVRYASSAGAQQDLLRAQVEGTRLQALHAQHHAEARSRLAQINALLSRPADAPLETEDSLPAIEEARTRDEIVAWSEASSPELRTAQLGVEREERAFALARLEGKPDLAVQGGYMFRGSLPLMWQVGGSVSLPSKGRARAALAEADARLAASKARLTDVRVRLRAAVEQRLALIQAAEEIADTYREGLLPQLDLAVRSALGRYAAGQGSQASALEASAAVIEDRTDYLRILATRAAEQVRLEEASLEDAVGIDSLLMHGRGAVAGAMSSSDEGRDDPRGRGPRFDARMQAR